jgi:ankyrin repeat protein
MPVRPLPHNPSLGHLKHQAKDLRKQHAARLPDAAQRLREFHPRFANASDREIFTARLTVADAQFTIARESGYASWTSLKRRVEKPTPSDQLNRPHHERIDDPTFRRAVDLIDTGQTSALEVLLKANPKLVHRRILFEGGNYFRSPTLLEFVAENPIRHGKLPANIVDIARTILSANPSQESRNETLMLVASGRVARECNAQIPLIDLLCQHGADPATAIRAAIFNEPEAVRALLRNGAKADLPVAAALNLASDFDSLLPSANPADRHLALVVAAQLGHLSMLRALLYAGEDPNRYNLPGGHSHATPLHLAAGAGHEALVRLLIESGARLDMRDVLWHATPVDWAAHEGKLEIEQFLREKAASSSGEHP